MSNKCSTVRKLFQILISLAIRRCRLSGILCRLTTSLKCFRESQPPSVRISVSDTGVGSNLEEFRTLDLGSSSPPLDRWDGVLSITTTSIKEKYIHHYWLNLQETFSSTTRLKRLPSTSKHVGTFSGTEVCLSTEEENIDEFVAWIVLFVQKMHVLKAQDILVDLSVEHIDNFGSRHEHVLPKTEDPFSAPLPVTTTECMCSGLGEYILKHRGRVEISCSARIEDVKVGMGHASTSGVVKNADQAVDVAIVIVPVTIVPCCLRASSQTTEVLYYQNFSPSSISVSALNTLECIEWQTYGLKVKEIPVDREGNAVLEWEDVPLAHIGIAIHSFNKKILPTRQETSNRKLFKKAFKTALDDLKAKHTGLFLSSHARKIQKYTPDLSRTIASLIASSNDQEFQGECASLLGLQTMDAGTTMLELCIQEKLTKIIGMNDMKHKAETDMAPDLFECKPLHDEDHLQEDEGDEDASILAI